MTMKTATLSERDPNEQDLDALMTHLEQCVERYTAAEKLLAELAYVMPTWKYILRGRDITHKYFETALRKYGF